MEAERHEIAFEIAGPMAMFARPDSGSTPISYPVPTSSAAKGMFEAVLRRPHIYVNPTKVEICKPIRFERYVTNYGGPLRKRDQSNYQLIATVLVDVCYRIHGEIIAKQMSTRGKGRTQLRGRRGQDWRLRFKEMFNERIELGQSFYIPCLGWKEFVPSYFGPKRKDTRRETGEDYVIPSLLCSMWEHHLLKPVYEQDWQIVNGLMSYVNRTPTEEELNAE